MFIFSFLTFFLASFLSFFITFLLSAFGFLAFSFKKASFLAFGFRLSAFSFKKAFSFLAFGFLAFLLQLKFISHAFYCTDIVITQFFTKFTDMNINCAVSYHNRIFPNAFQNYITGINFTWFRCQ